MLSKLLTQFRVLRFALVALITASAFNSTALAQVDYEGKEISAVVLRSADGGALSETRLRNSMSVRAGQTYRDEAIDEDVESLYKSGLIENVSFLVEPDGDKVKVIAVILPRAALGGVGFEGNTTFSDKKLAKSVEMLAGGALSDDRILAGRRKIESYYLDFGYADISVSFRLQPTAQAGVSDLIYVIDEGGKSVVRKILFEGNKTFTAKDLRKEMKTRQKGFFSFFTKSGQIDNEVLAQDIESLMDYYRDRGYVRVSSGGVRRVDVPKSDKVDLVITINEGVKYSVAKVSFGKLNVYKPEELFPALTLNSGDPYSGSKMKDDIRLIRRYYGFKGYADVRVVPDIRNAGPNQVNITYRVTEGQRYKVGRVNISGNTFTQDRVIRREIPLKPEDPFNTVDLEAVRARLQNINYFNAVQTTGSPSGRPGYRDINVILDEKKTGTISFGVGFSSIDSVVGYVNLEQTNFDIFRPWSFRGGGQRFSADLRVGGQRQQAKLRLVEPWFLGRKLSLGGELFYESANFLSDSYEQSNVGAAIFLRKPLTDDSYIRYEYRIENIEVETESNVPPASLFQAENGDFLRSAVALNYVFDNRDSQLIPRKGHKLDFGLEYAGSAVGGDVDVLKFNATASKYWNLRWDTILTLRGSTNVSDSLGNGTVPIFDRQFLGGQRNLRGFDFRDIGGVRDITGDVLGGGTSAYATVEYTAPLIESIRGAVFYDMGFVNSDEWDFAPDDLYSDYGVGLRLFLPFGPLAIDYAIPLDSPDAGADKGGQFNFYLNYQF